MSGCENKAASDQDVVGSEESANFTTLYLGYGSNMSPKTMKQRCPDSLYVGLGRLKNWKWIINSSGFANIVPSPGDEVYGGLFFLSGRDEGALDQSEGVPWEYEKHYVEVTRCGLGIGVAEGQTVTNVLAYVDFQRPEEGKMEEDYVFWVNQAMKDGLKCGVPAAWIERYMKPVTPEHTRPYHDMQMVRSLPTVRFRSAAEGARE